MPSYSMRRRSRSELTTLSMTPTPQCNRSATRTIDGRPSAIVVRRRMSSIIDNGMPARSTEAGERSSCWLIAGS